MKKSKIAVLVSIILKVTLVVGVISLFLIPKFYNLFYKTEAITFESQTMLYKGTFYLCALLSLFTIYELIKIFDFIYKNDPFNIVIEKRLKLIAVIFMVLSIIVGIKSIFIPTLISLAIVFITFIMSLSVYTLSQVFKKAIEYKNEIDFTV